MIQLFLAKYGLKIGIVLAVITLFGIQRHAYNRVVEENLNLRAQLELIKIQSDNAKHDVEALNKQITVLDAQRKMLIEQIGTAPRDPAKFRKWLVESIEAAK